MSLSFSTLKFFGGFVALYLSGKIFSILLRGPRAPLPPGPRPLPIIGNVLDLPKSNRHKHWAKYKSLYGPISSLTILGRVIVIINDKRIAFEVFEKNSSKYSNRATFTFGGELCGIDAALIFQQPGPRLRNMRKHFHQYIGTRPNAVHYEPTVELENRRFLYRTMQDPSKFIDHIRTLAGAIILKVAYGYEIKPNGHDPLVELIREAMGNFVIATVPGKWMVDTVPFLKHLPEWIPGMGFKKIAKEFKRLNVLSVETPFEFAQRQAKAGSLSSSNFTSSMLEQGNLSEEDEDILKWAASGMYAGGADTTVSATTSFFLAMLLHPEVLKCAQAEIDSVVGQNRLPSFSDRPNLPYIEAIVKESLRWNVVAPLGGAHTAAEDDVVEGYFIPKGTIMMPNVWEFTQDPTNYHEPTVFRPERFLGARPETDPRTLIFGFGRRICPGKEFAEASLFLTIAMCVSAFDIRKAKDAQGNDIEPRYEYSGDAISHPKDFVCSITPRSQKAAELVTSVQDEHPFGTGDTDKLDAISLKT